MPELEMSTFEDDDKLVRRMYITEDEDLDEDDDLADDSDDDFDMPELEEIPECAPLQLNQEQLSPSVKEEPVESASAVSPLSRDLEQLKISKEKPVPKPKGEGELLR